MANNSALNALINFLNNDVKANGLGIKVYMEKTLGAKDMVKKNRLTKEPNPFLDGTHTLTCTAEYSYVVFGNYKDMVTDHLDLEKDSYLVAEPKGMHSIHKDRILQSNTDEEVYYLDLKTTAAFKCIKTYKVDGRKLTKEEVEYITENYLNKKSDKPCQKQVDAAELAKIAKLERGEKVEDERLKFVGVMRPSLDNITLVVYGNKVLDLTLYR